MTGDSFTYSLFKNYTPITVTRLEARGLAQAIDIAEEIDKLDYKKKGDILDNCTDLGILFYKIFVILNKYGTTPLDFKFSISKLYRLHKEGYAVEILITEAFFSSYDLIPSNVIACVMAYLLLYNEDKELVLEFSDFYELSVAHDNKDYAAAMKIFKEHIVSYDDLLPEYTYDLYHKFCINKDLPFTNVEANFKHACKLLDLDYYNTTKDVIMRNCEEVGYCEVPDPSDVL